MFSKLSLSLHRYFSGLIIGCLQGVDKDTLLSPRYSPLGTEYWKENSMVLYYSQFQSLHGPPSFIQRPEVDAIAAGSYKTMEPPEIRAGGYVVKALEAVLWAFYHTNTFKDGCLKVGKNIVTGQGLKLKSNDCTVNLGDDADTVGAIYGQLAGAYYGVDAIPEDWKAICSLTPLIEIFATEIMKLADSIEPPDISTYRSIDWSAEYCPLVREKCEPFLTVHCATTMCCSIVSDVYCKQKLAGYDMLEEGNKQIVRKLNPCPRQYKKWV